MDKDQALQESSKDVHFLIHHPEWNGDKEVVLNNIKGNKFFNLQYVSDNLKEDNEVVLASLRQNYYNLEYAPISYQSDRELVMKIIKKDGRFLKNAKDVFKNDKEIVIEAVKRSGGSLKYASEDLKDDKEIVIIAVKENGMALGFASERLRKDKDVVKAAIICNSGASYFSLIPEYKKLKKIIRLEGESFLFACWNNANRNVRLQAAKHPSYLPTAEQISKGLRDSEKEVKAVYKLRKDEWLSKLEENQLKSDWCV